MTTIGPKRVADLNPGDSVVTTKSVVQKIVIWDRVEITWSDGTVQIFQPDDALPDVTDAD